MLIKERIKDFELFIEFTKLIRDNVDDLEVINASNVLINKLIELKEIFILSVTYNEVN